MLVNFILCFFDILNLSLSGGEKRNRLANGGNVFRIDGRRSIGRGGLLLHFRSESIDEQDECFAKIDDDEEHDEHGNHSDDEKFDCDCNISHVLLFKVDFYSNAKGNHFY